MAALLRGLRVGRVLPSLGSGMVRPQCSRLQRSFQIAALQRLQDESKSDKISTTSSSSSSLTHHQHYQAPSPELHLSTSSPAQEASTPELEVPTSSSAPVPEQEVTASAPEPEQEVTVSAPEQEVTVSAPEQEVTTSTPEPEQEVTVSAPEQEVTASAPEQEVSASPPEQEVSASPPEQEVSASPPEQEVSASPPEQEVFTSTPEQEVSASPSEQEVSASAPEDSPQPNSSDADQSGEESDDYETEEQLQARILTAALEFVPQFGWSVDAISAAVETLGLSSAAAGMFTNGAGDLILHFIAQCNAQLAEILAEQHNQVQLGQAEPKKTAEFLRFAVETRLRMLIPYIDTWPQAMSILLLPHNIPDSLKHLSTLIDDIWFYAGDRSTDLSWYTRRAALTGIYNTTELVMLQDSSPDFQDTWAFLNNRILDITNMANTAKQVQSTGEAVVQGIMGAAITLKNLAGMNDRR